MDSRGGVAPRKQADTVFAAGEPEDPYDDRHRQTKALALWERQRAAWARMQTRLSSAVGPKSVSTAGGAQGHGAAPRHAHSQRPSTLHPASAPEAALNFSGATSAARARREDLGLLAVARGDTTVDVSHAWEGQLRSTDATLVRRLVPIGRTFFPYKLYSEMRNPTTLPIDHMTYARVVSEGDVQVDAVNELTRQRAAAQTRVRAALTNAVAAAASVKTSSVAPEGEEKEAMTYYEDQLTRLTPYFEDRLGHFLQPRAFLQVEGQPAPYATAEEVEERQANWTGAGRASSAPPVDYFPPPPPQPQMWTSVPTSMASSRATSNLPRGGVAAVQSYHAKGGSAGTAVSATFNASPSTTPHGRQADNSMLAAGGEESTAGGRRNDYGPRRSLETANPSEMPSDAGESGGENANSSDVAGGAAAGAAAAGGKRRPLVRSTTTSPLHPMQVDTEDQYSGRPHFFGDDADGGGVGGGGSLARGPAMELSTRSLFFQTRPHELLQGTVTLRNTGTTTIYYSWVAVDPVAEQLRQQPEDAAGKDGGSLTEDTLRTEPREDPSGERPLSASHSGSLRGADTTDNAVATRITHALAAHQRAARENFFFLSSPLSGVVLPEEEGSFAFSVRATRVGLFQHTFELLTVPPSPERIFMRMRALVERDGPSWDWLAAPVAEAIETKVMLDTQRRLVQQISANDIAIEGAALLRHIEQLDGAADAAKAAERSRRRTQEDAWNLANRLSFDHIPYAACVYDKLDALYTAVQQTCWTLSHGKAARVSAADGDKTALAGMAARSGTPPPPTSGVQGGATPGPAPSTAAATPASGTETARGRGAATAAANAASPAPVPPQQTSEAAPASSTPGPEPPAPSATSFPARWDGSLLLLLQQMMGVRDAATRQLFFDAFLVLLRAARAVRPQLPGDHSEPPLDKDAVSLPVLLQRAAAILADGVRSRRAALLSRECEGLLSQKPAPSSTTSFAQAFTAACVSSAAATAATHTAPGTAAGAAAANLQGASTGSAGAGKKGGVSSRGKSGVTVPAASAAPTNTSERLDGRAGADAAAAAAEMSRAQRAVLDAVPPDELLGFSAIHVPAKTVSALEAAEEAAVRARREAELSAERGAWVAQYTSLFLEVIDAACDRGPLSSCSAARLAELEDIQTSALLSVDISADPVIPPTTGKSGKRK